VGASGGGKSTIGRLLYRFYDADEGSVKIDGQDIREYSQQSVRRGIGVVPQDTVLFNDTIKYNIMYANPEASEEEFLFATKSAQVL
jgi:ATP-binding cassette subfamily B protein